MNRLGINDNRDEVCPYLGSRDDPDTAIWYPSLSNLCYRAKPVTPIRTNYQRIYCLTATHSECKVYQNDAGHQLPLNIWDQRQKSVQSRYSIVYLWVILPAIVFIGLLIWQGLSGGLSRFTGWGDALWRTRPIALTIAGTPTPSIVPELIQRTATPTSLRLSPSPTRTVATSTLTLNSFHALETPIGIEHPFIIHRILDGESLDSISEKFGTTPQALRLVNYHLVIDLLTNNLIIIPVNQTDVRGLPAFQAFMVKKGITVEALSKQLLVDQVMLEYYNELHAGQVLAAGDWVLIPTIATATP